MSTRSLLYCCLAAIVQPSIAGYVLTDDYSPSNFFSKFSFFTGGDPTHGTVQYVDQGTAQNDGLIQTAGDHVVMGVDHTNVVGGSGRPSVRVTSTSSYNHGLIIADIAHMPEGCGTWPAFWMVGPDWPNNGEIDIIEGVNDQQANQMTLHTGPGCSIGAGSFSGRLVTSNCDVNAAGQSNNQGCGIASQNTQSYGSGFNSNGGGVYATQWTSGAINIWFFPRNGIPGDISGGNPNPGNWGTPSASFQGSCNIDNSIKNQQIVFDTTFCGDWAGNTWGSSSCASQHGGSCSDFVMNNPGAFANAYWSINSLKVYQDEGSSKAADNPEPSGIASTLPHAVSTLAPIPAGTPLTAMSWLANPGEEAAATTSANVDATVTVKPTGTPLTALSWAAPSGDVPAPPAPQAGAALTALSWPAPSAAADPNDASKEANNSDSTPWKAGDPLNGDFFGAGSQGIPAGGQRKQKRDQRQARRHASHLVAHQKRASHAVRGHFAHAI